MSDNAPTAAMLRYDEPIRYPDARMSGREEGAVMARYVLLRIEDEAEADDLIRDMIEYPHAPLLTPVQENIVLARLLGVPVWFDAANVREI